MEWIKLLSRRRYRGPDQPLKYDESKEVRSPFMKDADRIIFSPQFRRLQDKTQVHVLAPTDFVRTRLTHSLEVSSVGRSLGSAIGREVIKKNCLYNSDPIIDSSDIASIVASACLAHDIGNPPFGHAGEEAIKHWFKKRAEEDNFGIRFEQFSDLGGFEGNAQGFRIITRLAGWREQGGLRLTCATLGSFVKYPMSSTEKGEHGKETREKFSVFQDDYIAFEKIAEELGLKEDTSGNYARHPLAYIVEAADDICYLIGDIEDGVQASLIESRHAEELLSTIVSLGDREALSLIGEKADRIEYLRAKAIGVLIDQTVKVFIEYEKQLVNGEKVSPLLDRVESASVLKAIRKLCKDNLYKNKGILQQELVGFQIIDGLLDLFCEALSDVREARDKGRDAPPKAEKVVKLLPLLSDTEFETSYLGLMRITDYVSSLTDRGALDLYRQLKGIPV